MSRRLTLPLKKKWFDMIKSGIKKEEYREINLYWISRMINVNNLFIDEYSKYDIPMFVEELKKGNDSPLVRFRQFDEVEFTCGYPKKGDTERRLLFKNPKICVSYGIQDWGAEEGKKYFIITWKDRI